MQTNWLSNPMIQTLIPVIVAIFASSGLWSVVLYWMQRRDQVKDIKTKAILVLLHDAVYNNCERAIQRGYTTLIEFDNITEIYTVYRDMGGNGTGKQLYERVCQLPIHDKFNHEGGEGNDN